MTTANSSKNHLNHSSSSTSTINQKVDHNEGTIVGHADAVIYAATDPQKVHIARKEYQNRQRFLKNMEREWIKGILEPSLNQNQFIDLDVIETNRALLCPQDLHLHYSGTDDSQVRYNTSITDVYQAADQGCFLILGEPGSGKTTTLLKLAQDLIRQAQADATLPLPAILQLSTWCNDDKSKESASKAPPTLLQWLKAKLSHYAHESICHQWIVGQNLILFLDGLDEVEEQYRDSCIEAINRFRKDYGLEIIVCCRSKDYDECQVSLEFATTVYLQNLSEPQVENCLKSPGLENSGIRSLIQQNATFADLSKSPLMLNIMISAYQDMPVEVLPNSNDIDIQKRLLFNAYIRKMFGRRSLKPLYEKGLVIKHLVWLSKQMQRTSETVLFLEDLQRGWLTNSKEKLAYEIFIRGIIGMIWMGVHISLIVSHTEGKGGLHVDMFAIGLAFGVFGGVAYGRVMT